MYVLTNKGMYLKLGCGAHGYFIEDSWPALQRATTFHTEEEALAALKECTENGQYPGASVAFVL